MPCNLDAFLSLYDSRRSVLQKLEQLRSQRKTVARSQAPSSSSEDGAAAAAAAIPDAVLLRQQVQAAEDEFAELDARLHELVLELPNLCHPSTPLGDESRNAVVAMSKNSARVFLKGDRLAFAASTTEPADCFVPRNHVELVELHDLAEFESASLVSGTRFYFLKNELALLDNAVLTFALHMASRAGFTPFMTPDLVRRQIVAGCGFRPRSRAARQIYDVADSDLCLTATAEIPLAGRLAGQVLSSSDLPMMNAAFGRCFRTEVGHAGADVRGLYRVHQFSKVEMFAFTTQEGSQAALHKIVDCQQQIFESLGLQFRVLEMSSEELGASAFRKFDIETWIPSRGWSEISSASDCTDFQARRLNIRYREPSSSSSSSSSAVSGSRASPRFVHTVNGTACASPRILVALLESFQLESGDIVIPEVLRPYMLGTERISRQRRA